MPDPSKITVYVMEKNYFVISCLFKEACGQHINHVKIFLNFLDVMSYTINYYNSKEKVHIFCLLNLGIFVYSYIKLSF